MAPRVWAALLLALASACAHAGFDHELPLDQNGIWARSYQTGLEYGVVAVEVAGSLWFGNDNELGHTFWQIVDSSAISGIGVTVLKYAFSRARPEQGDNPAMLRHECAASEVPDTRPGLQEPIAN